ncbi:small ribosomal subunit protein mS26 [Ascaphus truei]|uniref:small ribosomal subunit protein mS26 n=1 Tax=Ascaphus truei TaxID=8439 RepID=UPI003F5A88F6
MLRCHRVLSVLLRPVPPISCMPPSRGRKSRTDPPSKSKAARIKYPPPVWAEELLNVTRRYKAYEDIMRAMRAEFKEGMLRLQYEEQVGSRAEQRHRLESEEHQALMAWNREESHRALRRREERLRREEDAGAAAKGACVT